MRQTCDLGGFTNAGELSHRLSCPHPFSISPPKVFTTILVLFFSFPLLSFYSLSPSLPPCHSCGPLTLTLPTGWNSCPVPRGFHGHVMTHCYIFCKHLPPSCLFSPPPLSIPLFFSPPPLSLSLSLSRKPHLYTSLPPSLPLPLSLAPPSLTLSFYSFCFV